MVVLLRIRVTKEYFPLQNYIKSINSILSITNIIPGSSEINGRFLISHNYWTWDGIYIPVLLKIVSLSEFRKDYLFGGVMSNLGVCKWSFSSILLICDTKNLSWGEWIGHPSNGALAKSLLCLQLHISVNY